ncbi:YfdX family protein [Acetobacter lambici]|uniref:YfdX family protein n=1 Tax=Acetobacter lambici TaxID=1332824 RepID=A0ABT1F2V4_9PROT|nr:YfdX family protein [Acetobacter lambici]MCP1242347.1 YfdX family protein [Acetobacter lambici]MCP1258463.1 YfdX family protein [Acetobacter lambici]NHO56829.1 YfdX family protein [Acetobacter lambici]
MTRMGMLLGTVLVATAAATPLYAQQAPTGAATSNTVAQSAATQDFSRLSDDGSMAFEYLSLARNAIFDGDLAGAKALIANAQQALATARSDNTAFQKAAAELMPSKTGQSRPRPNAPTTQQVAWLPIDGELVLNANAEETPEKTAVVAAANRHLKSGNPARAAEVLRVTSVDADYVIAAVPLDQVAQDVNRAAKLIGKDPYKASEALRDAQEAVRYASVDIQAVSNAAATNAKAASAPAAAAPAAAPAK